MVLGNPIRIGGRGGKPIQELALPALTATLEVIGGANPAFGWQVQWNFLSTKSFTQIGHFVNPTPGTVADRIGYGGGAQPAKVVDFGGPDNVYVQPQGSPMNANIPISVRSADFNSRDNILRFTFDGDKRLTFDYLDKTETSVWNIEQFFLEAPAMMAVEPVAFTSAGNFAFQQGAFRLTVDSQDALNAAAGESPTMGIDAVSGKPAIWLIGTAEQSNLAMSLESQTENQIVLDYLVTP